MTNRDSDFNEIYSSYTPLIESMAEKMMKLFSLPESDRDDLTQEAAIALYNAANSYKDNVNVTFGLYAKVCIKNRLNSYIHRIYNVSSNYDISLSEIEDKESSEHTPEQAVIANDSLQRLTSLIEKALTDYEYSVFQLYVTGMSYRDVAETLNKPVKSVDNTIHRIKKKIKALL